MGARIGELLRVTVALARYQHRRRMLVRIDIEGLVGVAIGSVEESQGILPWTGPWSGGVTPMSPKSAGEHTQPSLV